MSIETLSEPMVSKADAASLAVYYSAFCERPLDDDSAMIVWGGGLLKLQEKTGIELQRTDDLRRIVERAFRNKEAQRARQEIAAWRAHNMIAHIAALSLFAGAGALAIWSIIHTLKGN